MCVPLVKALIRKATALEKMKKYNEAQECLKTAIQIDDKKEYSEEIRKIMIRVRFSFAMEEALNTWGESPDSLDHILQSTHESFDRIYNEFKRPPEPSPMTPPKPEQPQRSNPVPPPSPPQQQQQPESRPSLSSSTSSSSNQPRRRNRLFRNIFSRN